MTPEEELRNLYNSTADKRTVAHTLMAMKYKHLVEMLNRMYPMLSDKKYSIGMKLYWFMNNMTDFPECVECGGPNRTNRCGASGYRTSYCSRKCAIGTHRSEVSKKTFLKKYGTENPFALDAIKEKRKKTNLEKYGVECTSCLESTLEKIKKTKLERYGDEHYTNIERGRKTNMLRYGVENPFECQKFQEKARETLKQKYGVDNPMHIEEIHDRVVDLGARWAIHNSYENYLRKNEFSEPNFSEEFYFEHKCQRQYEFEFRCRKCGNVYTSRIHNGSIRRCPKCYSSVTTSGDEQVLFDFLRSIHPGEIVRKDRSVLGGKELDILVPDRKLAIEYDGLYWHSELNGIGPDYHLEKTRRCEEKGIRLVHVFSDEWESRREIVQTLLGEILDASLSERILAGECIPRKLSREEGLDFMDKNHLLGSIASAAFYGLEREGRIVAAMSFSKRRTSFRKKSEEGEFEISRFCAGRSLRVVGAEKVLLEMFEKEFRPRKIVVRANRRFDDGTKWRELGFSLLKETRPDFFYLPNGCEVREHKFRYRREVMPEMLDEFDPELSDLENMRRNRFSRIWDCGSLVFEKDLS